MRIARRFLLLHGAVSALLGCVRAESNAVGDGAMRPGWVTLHSQLDPDNPGSTVRISLDTSTVSLLADGSFLAWIETRHSRPRLEDGRPFDREMLRFALRCGRGSPPSVEYQRVSATLALGAGPPVYTDSVALDRVPSRPWAHVTPGASADSGAFTRACVLLVH